MWQWQANSSCQAFATEILQADLDAIRDAILEHHARVMTAQETGMREHASFPKPIYSTPSIQANILGSLTTDKTDKRDK